MTKFYPCALAALVLVIPNALAFTSSPSPNVLIRTELNAGKNTHFDKIAGSAGAFFTGLVAATQIAFADPSTVIIENVQAPLPIPNTQEVIGAETSSSVVVSAFAGSGSMGGSTFETLDFSLPSYNEGTKGEAASPKDDGPPSFAPSFPELKIPGSDSKPAAEEKSAPAAADTSEADKKAAEEEKAAAKKAAEEDKVAAKKAAEEEKAAKKKAAEEEKAAKEKEAEEKAAAAEKKKADLEARKVAEKQKQEEMVARQKAAKDAADAAAAAAEKRAQVDIPPAPVTPIAAPKPVVAAPKSAPTPAPPAPEFKAPEFSPPDIKVPDIKLPSFGAISVPKFEVPNVDTSTMPKVDTSKLAIPSFGGATGSDENKEPLEAQEIRDEKAVDAKKKFVELDQKAQEIERKAVLARDTANTAKKGAKAAKDLACETRFGGKVLCIRPFGIGY